MARLDWVYNVVENLGNFIKVQEFNVCKVTCHVFRIPFEFFCIVMQSFAHVKILARKEKNHHFELAFEANKPRLVDQWT
jgi:hypothetical protein